MNNDDLDVVFRESYGLWISALFSALDSRMGNVDFSLKKEAFFDILELWLNDGKIAFCHQEDPLGKIWNTNTPSIIKFLKEMWPSGVNSSLDEKLNFYFFEIPAVLWRTDKGEYFGS